MKRILACLLSLGLILSTSTVAVAGLEDETVNITSPLTGARYQLRFSCASGNLSTIIWVDTTRWIRTEIRFYDGDFETLLLGRSFKQSGVAEPINLQNARIPATRFTLDEAYADPDGTAPETPYTRIAGSEYVCPDYTAPTPSVFVPITPERVLDTRSDTRVNHIGGQPGDDETVTIPLSDLPRLPAGAVAVSLTVTATETSAAGFVQVLPAGAPTGRSSNVNPQFANHTLANNAVSPLSADGVSVYTSRAGHLVADVNGYFVEAPGAARAGRYQALSAPTRIIDTRPASAINHRSGNVAGQTSLTIPVTELAGLGDDPVSAVAVNVTATETGGPGYLQSAATGTLVAGRSSIVNPSKAGDTVAAMTIVPVSADGEIDIYSSVDTHMVVDVLGWFTSSAAAPSTSGRFVPLDPERILDTRISGDAVNCCRSEKFGDFDLLTGRSSGDVRIPISLELVDRAGAESLMINLTAVDSSGPGYFQAGPVAGFVEGESSTVNATAAGDTVANAAIVRMGFQRRRGLNGIEVYTQSGGHVVADLTGYFTE